MRFQFTPAQDAFRAEIQSFLQQEIGGRGDGSANRAFSKKLAARGWIGIGWPKEYGGQGLGPIEQMIYTEEMVGSNAPRLYHYNAERQVGPSLMRHGTELQKNTWIPRIVNGDVCFCIGLSEPGAGSDLAAASTRAERDGDEYVVTGQKIWTTNAHNADMIWLFVRTNPQAPKHKGMTVLMVDMKSPGVTVRPLIDLRNKHYFNEVFFDSVRVPAANRVGAENDGWYIVADHLDFERSGIDRIADQEYIWRQVMDLARELAASGRMQPAVRSRLAEFALEREIGRLLCYRIAWMQSVGRHFNAEASVGKIFGTEWSQRMMTTAMQLVGMAGAGSPAADALGDTIRLGYMHAVSRTLSGGTSEIQRNVIATRGLGFPKG